MLSRLALVVLLAVARIGYAQAPAGANSEQAHYFGVNFNDVKWEKMFPEFGNDSPEISILRVDPKTKATQLLIRTPTALHVPKHWHSANETHTVINGTFTVECDDKRQALGPGSFNYIPARMQHEGWTTAGMLLFITVDSAWDINWVTGPPTKADLGVVAP